MNVNHFSFSKTGGAGRCAKLISKSQEALGVDANFFHLIDYNLRNPKDAVKHLDVFFAAITDEFVIKSRNTPSLFSLLRSYSGKTDSLKFTNEGADIHHFHWVEGHLSKAWLAQLFRSNAKVVWTLHDMVPFTGGCHYSDECDGFMKHCEKCPQVKPLFRNLVVRNLDSKNGVYKGAAEENTVFVAPSPWMLNQARKSSLLKNIRLEMVANPISNCFFIPKSREGVQKFSVKSHRFVLVVVAEDLANPVKRIDYLIELVDKLRFSASREITLLLVGSNGQALAKAHDWVIPAGSVSPEELTRLLDNCDVLLSLSSSESAGMSIKEAAARGVPSIVFGAPGAASTISNGVDGFIATSEDDLASKVRILMDDFLLLEKMGYEAKMRAQKENLPERVAARYLKLYEELLEGIN